MKPNILLIDNVDSFTYNLAQLLRQSDACRYVIKKHSDHGAADASDFDKIIFSPGAGLPSEYPVMSELLDRYKESKSFLGVCLGHQAIAKYFGARLVNLNEPAHGVRVIAATQHEEILFAGIPRKTAVGLYHSWAVERQGLPDDIMVTAETEAGIIMAITHRKFDIRGVQFHPESYMTEHGREMIQNWITAR